MYLPRQTRAHERLADMGETWPRRAHTPNSHHPLFIQPPAAPEGPPQIEAGFFFCYKLRPRRERDGHLRYT